MTAYEEAHWFFEQLMSARSAPVVVAGLAAFAASAHAVFTRRYGLARACAAAEIVLLLAGWALAQQPYFAYPQHTLLTAAAPATTIRFVLWSLPVGLAMVLPSLWLLLKVFKAPPR